MMLENRDLRRMGRESLRGNYGAAILNLFLLSAANTVGQWIVDGFGPTAISGPGATGVSINIQRLLDGSMTVLAFLLSLLVAFVIYMFDMGNTWGYVDLLEGERITTRHLILPLQRNMAKTALLGLRKGAFILLWSLLLIIPGVMKAYSWALAEFLYYDNPDMDPKQLMDESEFLMQGRRMKLFLLDLYYAALYFVPVVIWVVGLFAFGGANMTVNSDSGAFLLLWLAAGGILMTLVILVMSFIIEPRRMAARAAFYTDLLRAEAKAAH